MSSYGASKQTSSTRSLAIEVWPRRGYSALWLACPIAAGAVISCRSCRRANWTERVATRGW